MAFLGDACFDTPSHDLAVGYDQSARARSARRWARLHRHGLAQTSLEPTAELLLLVRNEDRPIGIADGRKADALRTLAKHKATDAGPGYVITTLNRSAPAW